jgi:hypothetical protein
MTGLYTHPKIKAIVNIAHGEGFGLPLLEAAREGLPVVTIGWSGQLDFLTHEGQNMFQKVDFTIAPVQQQSVWDGVIQKDSMWAYADQGSYKMTLRKTHKAWHKAKETAEKLKIILNDKFSNESLYEKFCNSIIGKSNLKPEPITGISFCIPTNGAKPEKTLLTIKSIKKELGEFPHEIIIAGDVSNFKDAEGVILIDKSEEAHSRRVATLRNTAGDNAKFDVIAWCDDDIIIAEDWLQNTLHFSSNNGWKILGNKVLLPDGSRYWDRASINPHRLVEYDHPNYDKTLYQSSAFFLARKRVFNDVRWDDNCLVYADREGDIPEDLKLSQDLKQKGYQFDFNDSALVWHADDSYTEFNNGHTILTLKKDILREKMDMHFFLPECLEFEDTLRNLNE